MNREVLEGNGHSIFGVLSRHVSGEAENNHKESLSRYLVFRSRFEPDASRIQV